MNSGKVRVAIFASGQGSNAEALIIASKLPRSSFEIVLIVSNNQKPGVKDIAERFLIPFEPVVMTQTVDLQEVESVFIQLLQKYSVDVITLCGFMKMIPSGIIELYRNRILNIHPSLLPEYGGKGMYGNRVHMAVIADKKPYTGATVHFVDEDYDTGAAIAQIKVPIEQHYTPEDLSVRVKKAEHEIYPKVVNQLCQIIYTHR